MKLPTLKDIQKLNPQQRYEILDKLDDCMYMILNSYKLDSAEQYWLCELSNEVSWDDYKKDEY